MRLQSEAQNFIYEHYSNITFPQNKPSEVWYFEHGLRFSNQKIKNFIQQRDILDIGAYYGESAYILQKYTKKHVISYEFSEKNAIIFKKISKQLNFDQNKVILFQKGISDIVSTINTSSCSSPGCSLLQKGNVLVEVSTIDNEIEANHLSPGFIKADVEGFGLKVIKGARKTILQYQPIFDISIYHSFEELFLIHDYFKTNFPNYHLEFHSGNDNPVSFGEVSLFCYPNYLE